MQLFANTFNLEHLIKKPTCFKGSPSCIDLIITNRKAYFKKACILETRISDFYKLTSVSLKSKVLKALPKRKLYRDYKAFNENSFHNDRKPKLDSVCTNLLRKTKFVYFCNLNVKNLNNNEKFWKQIKPLFSDKGLASSNIVLKEKAIKSLIIKN